MSKSSLNSDFSSHLDTLIDTKGIQKIAVAVSGGRDSLALTHLAKKWANKKNITLVALTVDHQLRKESKDECVSLKKWMDTHNIEHHTLIWEGEKPETGIQEKARNARYALLVKKCRLLEIDHLLLGHHRDDQAETLLMRIARGSGIDGLSGMGAVTMRADLTLIRPLLPFSRDEVTAYCNENDLPYLDDPSNEMEHFERVAWRKVIESVPNKDQFLKGLNLSAKRIARAGTALEYYADFAYDTCVTVAPEGYAILNLSKLKTYPDASALRVLRRVLNHIGGSAKRAETSQSDALFDDLMREGSETEFKGLSLGGCLIRPHDHHPQRTVVILREERHLPSPISLDGNNALWDYRFLIHCEKTVLDKLGSNVTLEALGTNGLNSIREHIKNNRRVLPEGVAETLPCLKNGETVITVPHLGYFNADHAIDIDKINITLQFTS